MADEPLSVILDAYQQQSNGAAVFIALATCFTGLELLAVRMRGNQREDFGWNDILIVLSFLVFVPLCACVIGTPASLSISQSLTANQNAVNAKAVVAFTEAEDEEIQIDSFATSAKATYATSILYTIASTLPKLSMCTLYLRVFSIASMWPRRVTYGMIVFLIVNCIAWLVPTILVCQPISTYWTPNFLSHGHCINSPIFGTWKTFPNIVSNLVMLVLPMPTLYKMNMARAKKIGVMITFMAGSVGLIGACLRFGFYVQRNYVTRPGRSQSTREYSACVLEQSLTFIESQVNQNIVTYLECGMYLIAACLPSLRVFVVHIHRILSDGFSSLMQKRRTYTGSSSRRGRRSWNKSSAAKIDVKLTGAGNLDTLVRDIEGKHPYDEAVEEFASSERMHHNAEP